LPELYFFSYLALQKKFPQPLKEPVQYHLGVLTTAYSGARLTKPELPRLVEFSPFIGESKNTQMKFDFSVQFSDIRIQSP
jgi:hypothetical protein